MWTVTLRDARVRAVLFLAGLALLLVGTLDLSTQLTVEREVVLMLPWGSEPGAVGRVEAGARVFGPRSFAVSEDRIYLADTLNRRVLQFDHDGTLRETWFAERWAAPQEEVEETSDASASPATPPEDGVDAELDAGKPFAVLPIAGIPDLDPTDATSTRQADALNSPWINDLVVSPHGHLILADAANSRLLIVDPHGELVETIDVTSAAPRSDPAGDAVWILEGLSVDGRGVYYLTHAYLSDELLTRRVTRISNESLSHVAGVSLQWDGNVERLGEALLPVPANSFVVDRSGRLYVESEGPHPFTRRVRAYTHESGGVRADVSWEIERPRWIQNAALIGANERRWVGLALNRGRADGVILVLEPARGILYELFPEWNEGYETNVFARLEGNALYVARPGPEAWVLERWDLRQTYRLTVPWGR